MMVQHHSLGEAWVTSPNICLDVYTRLSQTRHAHVIPNLFQYQWVSSISKSTELEPFKICFSVLCQDISVVCKHWEYNPNQLQTTISQHTVMAMYTELWQVVTKRTELLCLAKITEIESDLFWLILPSKSPVWQNDWAPADVILLWVQVFHIDKPWSSCKYSGWIKCYKVNLSTTILACQFKSPWSQTVWFTCKPVVWSTNSAKSGRDTWNDPQHAPSPAHP